MAAARTDGRGVGAAHRRPVDHGLGYEVLAMDRRVVVRVQLGPGIDGDRVYPPLERGTYLTIRLANTNS